MNVELERFRATLLRRLDRLESAGAVTPETVRHMIETTEEPEHLAGISDEQKKRIWRFARLARELVDTMPDIEQDDMRGANQMDDNGINVNNILGAMMGIRTGDTERANERAAMRAAMRAALYQRFTEAAETHDSPKMLCGLAQTILAINEQDYRAAVPTMLVPKQGATAAEPQGEDDSKAATRYCEDCGHRWDGSDDARAVCEACYDRPGKPGWTPKA